MIVTPFNKETQILLAKRLLRSHSMGMDLAYDLPEFGLIAVDGGEPVAMGFIRKMEGNYALLDSYITHADAPAELRDRALDIITYKLIKIAKDNDISKLIAFSGEPSIIARSINHGMILMPFATTVLSLK